MRIYAWARRWSGTAIQRPCGSCRSAGPKEKLAERGAGHFASGWAALILKDGKLEVTSYHDADTPVAHEGHTPLLILDVWEHAYYIDYRNARPNYAERVLKEAINWDFAAQNLDGQGVSRADQPA